MKVEELVGKVVVRTKTVTSGGGYGLFLRDNGDDTSFTTQPIYIEAVEQGVAYYRDKPTGTVAILGAKYRDEHWCPVSERFIPEIWKEPAHD